MAVINTDTAAECMHADTYSLYLSLSNKTHAQMNKNLLHRNEGTNINRMYLDRD